MARKSSLTVYEYWPQVLVGLSQITFGVAWASLFLPLDPYRVGVIILNLILTACLIWAGWVIKKKL